MVVNVGGVGGVPASAYAVCGDLYFSVIFWFDVVAYGICTIL